MLIVIRLFGMKMRSFYRFITFVLIGVPRS